MGRLQLLTKRTKEARLAKKKELVLYRGGKCSRCPFTPQHDIEYVALDFHHRDHTTKKFNFASNMCRSLAALKVEADKCDILCANCHRITEAELEFPAQIGRPRTLAA